MAIVREMTDGDAPASAETPYRLSLPDTHIFEGTLADNADEDWVAVELKGGQTYTITLSGVGDNADADTILAVYNSAGERVAYHDDVDYDAGHLHSVVDAFIPTADGVYYISVSAYRGNPTQDHSGGYRLSVEGGNVLIGTAGNDMLVGGAADDWLAGVGGADSLTGGAGNDTAYYGTSDAGVSVDLSTGTGTGGDAEGDTFPRADIENLYGSDHDDVLAGHAGANVLAGTGGNDSLDGRGGNDTLIGGPGADRLSGGAGEDTASYLASEAAVWVDLGSLVAQGGDAEGDTFTTDEVVDIENLVGSAYNDHLVGSVVNNQLIGGGGDDDVSGGDGDDILSGGPGDDSLSGGSGDDALLGGPGRDTMTGGDGADIFIFNLGDGDDWITDFNVNEDKIAFLGIDRDHIFVSQESYGTRITYFSSSVETPLDIDNFASIAQLFLDESEQKSSNINLLGVVATDLGEDSFSMSMI